VAVARWWRWTGAAAVTAAALVAWCGTTVSLDTNIALRMSHVSAPYTTSDYLQPGEVVSWYGGSLSWRFVYVCGLIGLAAIAAVAHGTVGRRRRALQWLAAGVAMVTLGAYLLAVFTGPVTRIIAF
jgi:hypothetical protein